MNPVEEKLKASPLLRWQCSDGCRHLRKTKYENGDPRYRCAFWDDFPMPIAAKLHAPNFYDLTVKRVEGPHTDEATRECPQFSI